ncbi:hypothetical protein [Lysinibacillus cavernae]|uniref:hypothetical protein n=1 Tax=Lysinibacillus cavernae TaxID=2666135 RepID=UPI001E563D9B|nr:hypothetical protein [Lysinibacillus cavernae]
MDYFERVIRLKDMEVWDIRFGKAIYRMFILDENRATESKDLNLSPNEQVFEEDLRENLITVKVYSEQPVKAAHITLIDQFSKQLTDHVALAHCDVVLTFYTGKIDDALKEIFKAIYQLEFEQLPLQHLSHFNQDFINITPP